MKSLKSTYLIFIFFSISNLLNAQFETVPEIVLESTRNFNRVIFSDIDQDGDDDIVGITNNEVHMLQNIGNGLFGNDSLILTTEPLNDKILGCDILIEDVDNDGLKDILTLQQFGYSNPINIAKIKIWRKTANLNYNLVNTIYPGNGSPTSSILYEDLDNDGLKDLIVNGEQTTHYKHTNSFNFIFVANYAYGIINKVADLNNDNYLDIIASSGEYIYIGLNNGSGGFSTFNQSVPPSIVYVSSSFIDVIDYDNDGDLDVIQLLDHEKKIISYLNNGSGIIHQDQILYNSYIGNFTLTDLILRDVNNDNILDIVFRKNISNSSTLNSIQALMGNGSSFSTAQTIYSNISSGRPCFSNNLGNGTDNVFLYGSKDINNYIKQIIVAKQTSPGVYNDERYYRTKYEEYYTNLSFCDINSDSLIDMFDPPMFHFNQGNGIYSTVFDSSLFTFNNQYLGDNFAYIDHYDINNDGLEDLIGVLNLNGKYFGYWLQNNNGSFQNFQNVNNTSINEVLNDFGIHDINNDGFIDIYFSTFNIYHGASLYYIINTGSSAIFQPPYKVITATTIPDYGLNIALNDYYSIDSYKFAKNTSSIDNIKSAFLYNSNLYILTNSNFINGTMPISTGKNAQGFEIADLNNDHLNDIIYLNNLSLGWLKNMGNQTFIDQGSISPFSTIDWFLSKDADNDLDIDFILCKDSTIYLMNGNGNGQFDQPILLTNELKYGATGYSIDGKCSKGAYLEDINNDTDLDLLFLRSGPTSIIGVAIGDLVKLTNQSVGDYKISGFVYNDFNGNKIKDNNEPFLPNVIINTISQNTQITNITNQLGKFINSPPHGNNQVTPVLPANWSISTDSTSYNVNLSMQNTIVDSLIFGLKADSTFDKIGVEIVGGFPRCNSISNIWIGLHNTGTNITSGVLELILDDSLTFINCIPTQDSIINNHYFWHYDSLSYFAYQNINIRTLLPAFNGIDDTISSHVINHILDTNGHFSSSTTDTLNQVVVCGYDPNDKTVSPKGLTNLGYISNNQKLEYLIRFQNTGNDTVINVNITDTIHNNLNVSSLEILATSHQMNYQINNGVINFKFDSILLPDSTINFIESQGFVKFSIELKPNLQYGDQITNKANIFFDSNSGILTNSTTNTIYNCNAFISLTQSKPNYCSGDSVSIVSNSNFIEQTNWYVNNTLRSNSNALLYKTSNSNDTIRYLGTTELCVFDTMFILNVNPSLSVNLMFPDSIDRCSRDSVVLTSNYLDSNLWIYNGANVGFNNTLIAHHSGTYILNNSQFSCSDQDTLTITFHDLPNSYILGGDTIKMCSSQNSYQLTSSELTGNNWYFLNNLLSQNNSITVSQEGYYFLHTQNIYCNEYSVDSIYFKIIALPSVDLMLTDTIHHCYGDTVILHSNYTNSNIWFHYGTIAGWTDSLVTTQGGTYILFTTQNSCIDQDTVTIEIHDLPNSTILEGDTVQICSAQNSIQLTSSESIGNSWYFLNNLLSQNNSIEVSQEGYYYLHTQNIYCSKYSKDSLYLKSNPSPSANIILNDSVLQSGNVCDNYSWFNCDNMSLIPNEINNFFTPANPGYFALIVSNSFGCVDTSTCINFSSNNILELTNSFDVSPNPTTSLISINGIGMLQKIEIYDVMARKLLEIENTNFVDLSTFDEGSYYVHFEWKGKRYIYKIIVLR